MIRSLCLVSLSIGTVLVIYGFNALESVASSFRHFLTDSPTDKTVWVIIAGTLLFGLGAAGAVLSPNPIGNHTYLRPPSPAPHRRASGRTIRPPSWLSRNRE